MTHTVRTTMRPDLEIEVSDADYLDMQRQGLLISDKPAAKPTPTTTSKAATAATTKEG